MSTRPASGADQVRSLRLLAFGFITAAAVMLVVLLVLSNQWDAPDDDAAGLGVWIAGVAGLIGLIVAVWQRNRLVAGPVEPARLLTSWIVAVACAEVGMLLGFVLAMLSRALTPFLVGAAILCVSLVVLTTALSQVELEV
jgi:hypothetical protein